MKYGLFIIYMADDFREVKEKLDFITKSGRELYVARLKKFKTVLTIKYF